MSIKFYQAVSMQVTKKQANELYPLLIDLGYNGDTSIEGFNILATNWGQTKNKFGLTSLHQTHNGHELKEYNKELFLAIAAMTKGDDWIIGEYLVYTPKYIPLNYIDRIFKVKGFGGSNSNLGLARNTEVNLHLYRKANLIEILQHFNEKEKTSKIDRDIRIQCLNETEFNAVKKYLIDAGESISTYCINGHNNQLNIIYFNGAGSWTSGAINNLATYTTPQELGIISKEKEIIDHVVNKKAPIKLQGITKGNLITLYESFECPQFRINITQILNEHILVRDNAIIDIAQSYIDLLKDKGTRDQQIAVQQYGIVLDSKVDMIKTSWLERYDTKYRAILNPLYEYKLEDNVLSATYKS